MLEALERSLAAGGFALARLAASRGRWSLVHGCDGHSLRTIDPEARGAMDIEVELAGGAAPGPGHVVAREAVILERAAP